MTTIIGSIAAPNKGDFSNRMQCAGAQMKESLKTGLAAGAVGIGGAAVVKHVAKNPRRMVKVAQLFDKVVEKFLPHANLKKIGKKSKVAMAIGVPLAVLTLAISGNHCFRAGQIDQKYTDKAKIEEHQKDILA